MQMAVAHVELPVAEATCLLMAVADHDDRHAGGHSLAQDGFDQGGGVGVQRPSRFVG
jgi:hypothetical protein